MSSTSKSEQARRSALLNKKEYPCTRNRLSCEEIFDNKGDLEKHDQLAHVANGEPYRYFCFDSSCASGYNDPKRLLRHEGKLRIEPLHSEGVPVPCITGNCSKFFHSKNTHCDHLQSKHRLACSNPDCHPLFTSAELLEQHLKQSKEGRDASKEVVPEPVPSWSICFDPTCRKQIKNQSENLKNLKALKC
ncbi:hypothetical protein T439DRAFT_41562 [Meredithblackwellia eburnea MCA 4105]